MLVNLALKHEQKDTPPYPKVDTCQRCYEGPIRDVVEEEWTEGWRVCAACGDEARRLGLQVVRMQ